MIQANVNKQIISLWIGRQSQQIAFGYYNVQAEQIFHDEQDPVGHSSVWENVEKLQARMIIFDTQINRLAVVREVNNKKMIHNMKKQDNWNSLLGMFGQIDSKPLQAHENTTDAHQWPMHSNWTDTENNYFVINKNHISLPKQPKQGYSADLDMQRQRAYEQFYGINREESENRVRRLLQKTDYLKLFTICTDEEYSGYTYKMIEYLKQSCPKQCYVLTSVATNSFLPIFSLPKFYDEVDIFLPIDTTALQHPYFKNASLASLYAPYFNCLYTPFTLKNVDPYTYVSSVVADNRKLFNSVFTLPLIDTNMELHQDTNIFRFQEAAFRKQNNKQQYQQAVRQQKGLSKKNNPDKQQERDSEIKLNFSNCSYLSLSGSSKRGKFVSESYVLKGHFNNFEKQFKLKSEPSSLNIKYLQGIISSPQKPQLLYDKFYVDHYENIVEAYPYHLVMVGHEIFGDKIRESLQQKTKKGKIFNEEWPQSVQQVLAIADYYSEHMEQDD